MAIKGDISEKELVQQCLKGNVKSQELLYQRYSSVVFTICMRYSGNRDNAQDMLQEAFIKVFEGLKYFRHEGSFEGWVKRVAVNTCLDHNKKLKNEPYSEDVDLHAGIGESEQITVNLNAGDLVKLLQRLPSGYRTVFNLYAIEGYSHSEISTMMGTSESTSKTQLFKARKMLQGFLAEMDT
jgi:RNA polymerase sigma-70 factor (ECF subfamily)